MIRREFFELIGKGAGAAAALPLSARAKSLQAVISGGAVSNFPVSDWERSGLMLSRPGQLQKQSGRPFTQDTDILTAPRYTEMKRTSVMPSMEYSEAAFSNARICGSPRKSGMTCMTASRNRAGRRCRICRVNTSTSTLSTGHSRISIRPTAMSRRGARMRSRTSMRAT